MSWDRAAYDAFDRQLGYSQEYLDRVHKGAEEYRAVLDARGSQLWEPAESDTDLDDAHLAPLSPPPSPRGDRPDLSEGAWGRRILADLSRGIEVRDSGFDNFEKWRSQMISEHVQKILPTPCPSKKSNVRRRQCRRGIRVTERLSTGWRLDTPFPLIDQIRITRSKVTLDTSFYELGHDGKTGQTLSVFSSMSPSRSWPPLRKTKSSQQPKHRSACRIQKI